MTCRRYQKLTQYLHVSGRSNEPAWNTADYDKLYKIHPVLNMVQDSFAKSHKPGQNQTIDEGMMAIKGRLSCVQCLPAKPIRRGINGMDVQWCWYSISASIWGESWLARNTLSWVLDMMSWWSYVRIYQENIMSIVTTIYICSVTEGLAGL